MISICAMANHPGLPSAWLLRVWLASSIFWLGGCAVSPGSERLPADHFAFNDAIAMAESREMLLNVVRIRYADPVKFLEVGTVGSSFSIGAGGEAEATLGSGPSTLLMPSVAYTESPTLTFLPRGDSEFAMDMLAPISLSAALLGLRSTPNLIMELHLTVAELNGGLQERGPAGDLYRKRAIELAKCAENGKVWLGAARPDDGELIPVLLVEDPGDPETVSLMEILGTTPGAPRYPIRSSADITAAGRDATAIYFSTRSVLEMMTVMAGGVVVPAAHVESGIVPPLSWFPVDSAELLQFAVKSGTQQPPDRLAIRHRDYWFWIADSDMVSKSAFLSLLTHFNVQAKASSESLARPVLTLPIGQ